MQLTFVVDDALDTGQRKRSAKACEQCKARKVSTADMPTSPGSIHSQLISCLETLHASPGLEAGVAQV